jgi:serine phosphatase RsbU (regulator of sigma subunit)
MIRKIIIAWILIIMSPLMNIVRGQDTLSVQSDLRLQRKKDSIAAANLLDKAGQFFIENQIDTAFKYVNRSVNLAADGSFLLIEAKGYELLGSIHDARSDWEETLRNYLRASSIYTRVGDKKDEAGILHNIALKYFNLGVYQKSAEYSTREYLLYAEPDYKMLASSCELAARSFYYLPDDSLSARWYNAAAQYFEKDKDETGSLNCIDKLGLLYTRLGDFDQALEKYNTLLSVYREQNDFKNLAFIYNQIGFLKHKQNLPDSALVFFFRAVEFSEKGNEDIYFLTDVWSNIAICQQNIGNLQEMLDSFRKALEYAKKSGRTDEAARIERILATIYFREDDNYHAELYCQDCIESAKESANLNVLQLCYKDYSAVLERGNDFVKALEYYEKYLSLRDSLNYENRLAEKTASDRVSEFEATEQRLRNELATEEIHGLEMKTLKAEAQKKDIEMNLLLKQQALARSEKDLLAQSLALEQEKSIAMENAQKIKLLEQDKIMKQLEIEKKTEQEKALQNANKLIEAEKNQLEMKAEKEKQIRKMAVGIGVLMLLVAVTILAGLLSARKKNQKLAESKQQIEKINTDLELTNAEVLKQKEIIEQKNQSITDSIQYASRIQTAVLPPDDFLGEWELENFILYKPKDIVSGDFYWGVKKNEKIIVAAGDCTGHGVPGAFMSMLGHAFLEEIVNTKEIIDSATILNLLRDEIINTLKQKGTAGEARDGMDISLVIMDVNSGKLEYAGANNPLYIIRDGKLLKFSADRMPIGIHFISFTPFTNQTIEIKKGDFLYLFSDGYADQFGGPKGKKFMYIPFQELLLRNHSKSMAEQKEILDITFEEWKGDREQVDDVLVIGIHL